MRKRILVASPVQQKPEILAYFLESLKGINQEGFEADFLFVDDNQDEASRRLLEQFKSSVQRVSIVHESDSQTYLRDEHTHYWNDDLVNKVAAMKDRIIEYTLEREYEALFLIDSDLLVHPDCLQQLLEADKDIISALFWTKWQQNTNELPQVWLMDEYSFVQSSRPKSLSEEEKRRKEADFLKQLRVPGIYEVGGLGACTLISRHALKKGARFKRLSNVSFWGEDRHFCIRAAALGLGLYVDTRLPAYHIYRDADLEGAGRFLRSFRAGAEKGIGISLCMIVKNEEEALPRCLSSAAGIADEIIIVDTGSKDRTRDIAKQFNAIVYDFEWVDDFSAARNYAFERATLEYILWLDADDVLEEKDRLKFLELKTTLPADVDSVMMNYHLAVQSDGTPSISFKRNRLVKRSRGFRWVGPVHEYLEVSGHILHSDIAVTHRKDKAYTDRNLRIYRKRLEAGERFSARDKYYFANELKDHAFYEEAVLQYERFLATKQGWVEDNIAACIKMSDCYAHMYERDQQIRALLRTMEYDSPRAESCCRLGAVFLAENRLQQAVYWYEAAAVLGDPPTNGAIVDYASWTWLPYLQLCVCYDKLGLLEKAYACNEKALAYKPDHASMLYNKKYLEEQLAKKGK